MSSKRQAVGSAFSMPHKLEDAAELLNHQPLQKT